MSLLAIKRSAGIGNGRTMDLVGVVNEVGRSNHLGLSMQFGWVKAHVGIEGNEHADRLAKAGCRKSLLPQITEGGCPGAVEGHTGQGVGGNWVRYGMGSTME